MQSSCKIIKSTLIKGDALISPPVIEKIIEKNISEENEEKTIEILKNSIFEDAKQKAKTIIELAQKEAEKIVAEANEKINLIFEDVKQKAYSEGYSIGYQEGYKKGYEEGKQEAESLKKNASNFVKNAEAEVKEYIKRKEEEIIRLSLEIAKQVIKTEVTLNSEAIVNIAKNVISKSLDKHQIILKVNPKDYNILKSRKDELEIFVENPNDLILIADPDLQEGDVVAETPSGYINAKIDVQLDIILNNLLRND
ncbi:flagellar assembly protein FliH [Caloramator fervidus]|uniref:Flagellar assembly protein FliH n=1 Tax=Caloramator fervidus TaxID=29344 RepID=A0A1H5SEN9_9CLOT|nr:FliH/SctL family protein [Caloramator fervidus]SEF48418.1 flagellar assembly protein FliH [Caloramator fervidus]